MKENSHNSNKKFYVTGKVWINFENSSFIGDGKIELIEKIKEFGSLRKAATEMKISYRKAWQTINKINNLAAKPLVILKRGGKNGGIAIVTEYAEKVILTHKNLQKAFNDFLIENTQNLNF